MMLDKKQDYIESLENYIDIFFSVKKINKFIYRLLYLYS